MPDDSPAAFDSLLTVTKSIQIPLDEFNFSFARSQGPGGQNVNKVNSKATLRWPIATSPSLPAAVRGRFLAKHGNRVNKEGLLVVTSQRYRDQLRNREDCLAKLQQLLQDVATPPPVRRPSKPTKGSRRRRRKAKEAHSMKKSLRKPPRYE